MNREAFLHLLLYIGLLLFAFYLFTPLFKAKSTPTLPEPKFFPEEEKSGSDEII